MYCQEMNKFPLCFKRLRVDSDSAKVHSEGILNMTPLTAVVKQRVHRETLAQVIPGEEGGAGIHSRPSLQRGGRCMRRAMRL